MSKYESVLFDWDGCLYDSLGVWSTSCQKVLTDLALSIDPLIINREILPHLENSQRYGVEDIETFINSVLALVQASIHESHFNPGVLPLIQQLSQSSFPYAIVTSCDTDTVAKTLDHHQLHHFFPHRVTRNDVSKTKPHPEPIYTALKRLNTSGRAVIVGDNSPDIIAGQAAGIDTVLYYPESHEQYYDLVLLKQLNPTFIIRHFAELEEIIF